MATYYVYSGAAGANTGESWTNAFTALSSAISAASTSGDVILVHKTHSETFSVDTVYTFLANVLVICVDKDNSNTLSIMGSSYMIGPTSGNSFLNLTGAYKVFIYGLSFRSFGNDMLAVGQSDGAHFELENCYLYASQILRLSGYSDIQAAVIYRNCTFRFSATSCYMLVSGYCEIIGGEISSSGSKPSTIFSNGGATDSGGAQLYVNGFDLSYCTNSTLVANNTATAAVSIFTNCKLPTGMVPLATQSFNNLSAAQVYLYNCSSGDEHYHIAHHSPLGSTVCDTGIYVNDGASYDGTNKLSWKLTTSSYVSMYTPYVSPWIDRYHSGTSAITPYLECLRDNSSGAVFQDDEIWAEFSYQGTTGYPKASFAKDRMAPLGSAADQTTSSKSSSDWTGETGTPGLFKIDSGAAITPAEIGHLRARIVVGEPSVTVYVDPQIRGTA